MLGEEDHARARAPDRVAGARKGLQVRHQAAALGDQRHRRALAAGDDEAGDAVELLLRAHLDDLDALQLLEDRHVLAERALQREHADAQSGVCVGCHLFGVLAVFCKRSKANWAR